MWSKGEEVKIINFRARSLVGIGTVFDKYIEEETEKTSSTGHHIKYLGTDVSKNDSGNENSLSCCQMISLNNLK